MPVINAIRSILFNVVFYLFGIVFLSLIAMPTLLFKTEKQMRWAVGAFCRGSLFIARWVMGIKTEYRGLENLPTEGGFILAAAHQSNMDPIMTYPVRGDVTALAKKELFAMPLVGPALRKINIVRIDRQSHNAHKDMKRVGEQVQEQARPLIVYPQATRVPIGQNKRLKSGAFHLYEDTGLPVVTVATNTGLFWGKGFWHRSGTAVFEVHPAFPQGLQKDEFMSRLQQDVVERSRELVTEAGYGHLLPKTSDTKS